MKAREVVPGWPRGRSSESLSRDWELSYRDTYWPRFFHRNHTPGDIADFEANRQYHLDQAEMLNTYLERYRRKTEHGDYLLDPGKYLDMYGNWTEALWIT